MLLKTFGLFPFTDRGIIVKVQSTLLTFSMYWLAGEEEQEKAVAGKTIHPDLDGKLICIGKEQEIPLEVLQRRKDLKDASMFGITSTGKLFNVRAATMLTKAPPHIYMQDSGEHMLIQLFVPDTEATFDDMLIMVFSGTDLPSICLPDFDDVLSDDTRRNADMRQFVLQYMPGLNIQGPLQVSAGDTAIFAVAGTKADGNLYPWPLDVYLESVNGLLPKKRVRVNEGYVEFPLLTLGLQPGDSVKLKAGFCYFSGVTEKIVEII